MVSQDLETVYPGDVQEMSGIEDKLKIVRRMDRMDDSNDTSDKATKTVMDTVMDKVKCPNTFLCCLVRSTSS